MRLIQLNLGPEVEARFWKKGDLSGGPDACWPWLAATDKGGYGQFHVGSIQESAARMAYRFKKGPIPEGLCTCHTCDNRRCCNPGHLWLGTSADNTMDRHAKGRDAKGVTHGSRTHPERLARGERNGKHTKPQSTPRGEKHGNAKLTADDVREIRTLYANGWTQDRIAGHYGIHQAHVADICNRKAWAHVT